MPRRTLRPRRAAGTLRWVCPSSPRGLCWGAAVLGGEWGADPPLGSLVAGHGAGWRHSGQCPRAAAKHRDGPRAGWSLCHLGVESPAQGRWAPGGHHWLAGLSQGLGPGLHKRTLTGSQLLPACFLTQLVFRSQGLPLPHPSRAPSAARGANPAPCPHGCWHSHRAGWVPGPRCHPSLSTPPAAPEGEDRGEQ